MAKIQIRGAEAGVPGASAQVGAGGATSRSQNGIDPMVEQFSKDFRRLRAQKHRRRGGIEARILMNLCFYEGEHYASHLNDTILSRAFKRDQDKNKLRLVFNLFRRQVDRKLGRLWSIAHGFKATPNVDTSLAYDKAEVISDKLIPALDGKCRQGLLRWQIYKWLLLGGVCVEHIDWRDGVTRDVMPKYDPSDPTGQTLLWTDNLTSTEISEQAVMSAIQAGAAPERFEPAKDVQLAGDVCSQIYDPMRFFIDASVLTIHGVNGVGGLGPDQACYFGDVVSIGWIKETFGSEYAAKIQGKKDVSLIETKIDGGGTAMGGMHLKDLLPGLVGSAGVDDPELCILLTRYQPPHEGNPYGTRTFLVPDQCILDHDAIPYPEIPAVDYHWGAPTTTFWTNDFASDLIAPSKFLDKRLSQLGEAANAQIYELLLLGPGLESTDIPTDFPGTVKDGVGENGAPMVQTVPRGQLPAFFVKSIEMVVEFIEQLGDADLLAQRKFPGQLRGTLTVPMLQEILDSVDGPRFSHIGDQFAIEKQMRINRVKQYYPPIRTMNFTGPTMRQEVLELHTDKLLRAGTDFTITVDPSTLLPEISAMRHARVKETISSPLAIIYTDPRTGRLDPSKIAQDLKYGDAGREARASQYRKLARQLLHRARQGAITSAPMVDPTTGQPAVNPETQRPQLALYSVNDEGQPEEPFTVYPFWMHSEMMDEYEAEMATTEFLDASPAYKRVILMLYEAGRRELQRIQDAQAAAIENKAIQSAVAQATQQAAAQAASLTVSSTLEQVVAQGHAADGGGMGDSLEAKVRELMGDAQSTGNAARPPMAQMPQRPQ